MHAYLLIGDNLKELDKKAAQISKKLNSKINPYTIASIEDVRNLEKFTRLKLSSPTTIYIKEIDNASLPALNAFLKNLEEPQINLSYILTSTSSYNLIPTIISRCQIITFKKKSKVEEKEIKKISSFLKGTISDRFEFLDTLKTREEAIEFLELLSIYLHQDLLEKEEKSKKIKILAAANYAIGALKANGNINLQLTNFVIKF